MTPDAITLRQGARLRPPDRRLVRRRRLTAEGVTIGDLGSTFGGGPVACAAALATLDVIEREGSIDNAVAVGEHSARGRARAGHPQGAGTRTLLGLQLARPGGGGTAGPLRPPHPHRHGDRIRRSCACCRRSRSRGRGRAAPGRPAGGAGVTKRDFLALEDWAPAEVDALLALAARVKRGEVTGGLEKQGAGDGVHGPEPSHSYQLRDRDVPPRWPRGGARAGQGELVVGDRARRGDGRRHGRAHRGRGPGARALRRRGRRARFPAARLGRGARGRRRPGLRQVLREAGHQPGVGAAPPLPGAGRRDDAAEKLGETAASASC